MYHRHGILWNWVGRAHISNFNKHGKCLSNLECINPLMHAYVFPITSVKMYADDLMVLLTYKNVRDNNINPFTSGMLMVVQVPFRRSWTWHQHTHGPNGEAGTREVNSRETTGIRAWKATSVILGISPLGYVCNELSTMLLRKVAMEIAKQRTQFMEHLHSGYLLNICLLLFTNTHPS